MLSDHDSGSHSSMMRSKPAAPADRLVGGRAGGREPERGRGVEGVADVQVVGEGLGPVLGRVHGGVGRDVACRDQPGGGTLRVVAVERLLVVGVGIAEQLLELVTGPARSRPGP